MMLTLKTQNLPFIGVYTIFNTSIFLTLINTKNIDVQSIQSYFEKLSLKDGLFFSILPLLLIIMSGIFSNKIKEIIVFWRLKDRLPGCRAFSLYAKEDSRIDLNVLKSKYGEIPTFANEQNQYWYKIFKSLNDKSINNTHKEFLLCRELSVMTIMMLSLILPVFWFDGIKTGVVYFSFLALEYLMVRSCAKNNAERLVVNTLALVSCKKCTPK